MLFGKFGEELDKMLAEGCDTLGDDLNHRLQHEECTAKRVSIEEAVTNGRMDEAVELRHFCLLFLAFLGQGIQLSQSVEDWVQSIMKV
jgi:hypothetical protein